MTVLTSLEPSISVERLYPENAAFMARTDLKQTRMLSYTAFNQDSVTCLLMGLLGKRSSVRHRSGVTDEVFAVLNRAGLPFDEDVWIYETGRQAEKHADDLIEAGKKLFWPYPLKEGRFPQSAHLVPPDLWQRLNAKQHLDELVACENLSNREIFTVDQLLASGFKKPAYLKAGGELATGNGYVVRYCHDCASWDDALQWFGSLDAVENVIVEDAIAVHSCWCAAIIVEQDQTSFAGAAEQTFTSPGCQSGSIIDPQNLLPAAGVQLAIEVGEAARGKGFIGMAGLDIGLTTDGRFIIFDPNFRFNASSSQVLFHDSATHRSGLSTSYSFYVSTQLQLSELAQSLRGPIDDGWFVPTRLIDGKLLPAARGKSVCSGFVLGENRHDVIARHDRLTAIIKAR